MFSVQSSIWWQRNEKINRFKNTPLELQRETSTFIMPSRKNEFAKQNAKSLAWTESYTDTDDRIFRTPHKPNEPPFKMNVTSTWLEVLTWACNIRRFKRFHQFQRYYTCVCAHFVSLILLLIVNTYVFITSIATAVAGIK